MKEPVEKNEKRMHVEIIKVSSTKVEPSSNSLSSGLDLEDDPLIEELSDADFHDQKMNSNHNHDIPVTSARSKQPFVNGHGLQSANQVPNKENKFLKEPQILKEKDSNQNGNHILANSKVQKPKEYKFVKNKGRWVCKDTKEMKNEGRELNEIIVIPTSNGKISNLASNPITTSKPPTPVPIAVPNPDFPDVNLKPTSTEHNSTASQKIRELNLKPTSILKSAQDPLEVRMNSVIHESWDIFKQNLIQNLNAMYQQETQNLTERISQLIGLLTTLQNENTQLRAELDKYRAKQPPPN